MPLRPSHLFVALLVLVLLGFPSLPAHAVPPPVGKLKKLHLRTDLVHRGKPAAVLVAPEGPAGRALAERLRSAIHLGTGASLEIVSDRQSPEGLLARGNVIALGSMADNRFIAHLYRQWRVILDATHPGPGGYLLRSLHDPYGTGRNVLFVGGSDPVGLERGAESFLSLLKPGRGELSVGWLMETRLAPGLRAPEIDPSRAGWEVFTWNDSHRRLSNGRETGYAPGTFFGWNSVGIAGALYYMTGERAYLDCFKTLALPDPARVPQANRGDSSFSDPLDPLVQVDHYRSHLVPLIWDLIEESPLFTDRERLAITRKLRQHQLRLDPDDSYRARNGDRHAAYHLLNIYTGSRYFATYYPDPSWRRRLANVRSSFASFLGNPTWCDRDTLHFVPTSLEPVFDFFLMDGLDEFVASGTARSYLLGLEILSSGEELDDGNRYLSDSLLHKGAFLTGENSYARLGGRMGYQAGRVRVGQSFRGAEEAGPVSSEGKLERVAVLPLARSDWRESGTPVPFEDAFQILSYRTGWDKGDDYLLLDGFEGRGRHPYGVNTLSRLRLFGGRNLLAGGESGVAVWRDGMAEAMPARGAALLEAAAVPGVVLVQSEVPDMTASRWRRSVLGLRDRAFLVIDRLLPVRPGEFDLVRSWHPAAPSRAAGGRRVLLGGAVALGSADAELEKGEDGVLRERLSRRLEPGDALTLGAVLAPESRPVALKPVPGGGYLLTGTITAFAIDAPADSGPLSSDGAFTFLERSKLVVSRGRKVALEGVTLVAAAEPVTLVWELAAGRLSVRSERATTLVMAGAGGRVTRTLPAGDSTLEGMFPPSGLEGGVDRFLRALERGGSGGAPPPRAKAAVAADWQPVWEKRLPGAVRAVAVAQRGTRETVWAAAQEKGRATLLHLDQGGAELGRCVIPGELLTLWGARGEAQASSFSLLAGFRDDTLYALAADGGELWRRRAEVSPEFRKGERYEAPWFTDPLTVSGVSSLLVVDLEGRGGQEIILGRPSTLEFRTLSGDLKARVGTRWGTNTALALLQRPGLQRFGRTLLAGKGVAGNPTVTAVSAQRRKISDGFFDALPPGFADMHAWLQRGVSHLAVADLSGGGSEQVALALSGHWNELRVYGADNAPLWMKSFGPDVAGGGFMRGLQLLDLDGSGRKKVILATRAGWLFAFDHTGTTLWRRRLGAEPSVLTGSEATGRIAVGCADGTLLLLDGSGTTLHTASLGEGVRSLAFSGGLLLAGSAGGRLTCYQTR